MGAAYFARHHAPRPVRAANDGQPADRRPTGLATSQRGCS
ncbi:hypothetical protein AKJ09_00465 [Labilithrix luteola]|uniref:Uncharacterized protein n=1 Tax=Labilithrix luteola TaxID=1391654 RepID=A0A0K1PK84_9BACT|nr:hypothetical protein AKJ09_00465 [Labilithrix luteola]